MIGTSAKKTTVTEEPLGPVAASSTITNTVRNKATNAIELNRRTQ